MTQDLDIDVFQAAAERAGLRLTSHQAQEALAGANRWQRDVAQLRGLLRADFEPAAVFRTPRDEHGV